MLPSAIILAPHDRGLYPLFGVPAVRRLVKLALDAGIEDIHLIGRIHTYEPVIEDLLGPDRRHEAHHAESAVAAAEGLPLPDDDRILVMAAHLVIDRRSFNEFAATADDGPVPRCLCSSDAVAGPNCGGIVITGKKALDRVFRLLWSPEGEGAEEEGALATVRSKVALPYLMGDGRSEIGNAEQKLVEALTYQTAADDGFLARHVDRRISQMISRRLAQTRLTPNLITLLGVSIGLSGATLLAHPGYGAQLLGALLFLFCVIVDGVDGEVARLKLQETVFGHYLDIITDNLVHAAVFVGIAYGQYYRFHQDLYLYALWLLLGGFVLCLVAVYQCVLRKSEDELQRSPRLMRIMALMTNRDFAYLVVLLAACDRLRWFLLGSALGTYLFAGVLWLLDHQDAKRAAMAAQEAVHP